MTLTRGEPVTCLIDGRTCEGRFERFVPRRPDLAWVWLPGAGDTTDIFLMPTDQITPKATT